MSLHFTYFQQITIDLSLSFSKNLHLFHNKCRWKKEICKHKNREACILAYTCFPTVASLMRNKH